MLPQRTKRSLLNKICSAIDRYFRVIIKPEAPVTLESRPLMALVKSSRSVDGLLYALTVQNLYKSQAFRCLYGFSIGYQ
jgi:hypothetical protein